MRRYGFLRQLCRTIMILLAFGGPGIPSLSGEVWAAPQEIATVNVTPSFIEWQLRKNNYEAVTLRVSLPNGGPVLESQFHQGEVVAFDLVGNFPDGSYTYELIVTPRLAKGIKQAMENSRKKGDTSVVENLLNQGVIPRIAETQTGYFTVANGAIVLPTEEE